MIDKRAFQDGFKTDGVDLFNAEAASENVVRSMMEIWGGNSRLAIVTRSRIAEVRYTLLVFWL